MNARFASTGSILCARARDIAHCLKQLLRALNNGNVKTFIWTYPEGMDNRRERSEVLRRLIDRTAVDVKQVERQIQQNRDGLKRFRLANRGGGSLVRILRERRQAIVGDLAAWVHEHHANELTPPACRLGDRESSPAQGPNCPSSPSPRALLGTIITVRTFFR